LKEPSAEKSFGICFECETGVHFNLVFSVCYSKRSAKPGHPDGANNLGFCFEYRRDVEQDSEEAG
jgi:TPR repeat protein